MYQLSIVVQQYYNNLKQYTLIVIEFLWVSNPSTAWLGLLPQGLTRLPLKCPPGLWSHLRLNQARICFQVHLAIGSIYFLVDYCTEGLNELEVTLSSFPHGAFQYGQKGRASLSKTDITILCNVIIGVFAVSYWLITGPTHTQEEGIAQGHENQEMGITGTILEFVHHPEIWF